MLYFHFVSLCSLVLLPESTVWASSSSGSGQYCVDKQGHLSEEVSSHYPEAQYHHETDVPIHSIASDQYQSDASASSQWHHYALDNPESFDIRYDRDTLHLDHQAPAEQAQSWYVNPLEYRVYHTIGQHHITPASEEYSQNYLLDPVRDAARSRERRAAIQAPDIDTYELEQRNARIRSRALRWITRLDGDRIGEYKGAIYVPSRHQVLYNSLLPDRTIVERFHSPNGPRMPSLVEDLKADDCHLSTISLMVIK